MAIYRLKQLNKSTKSIADLFRGVSMDAYTNLITASENIEKAITAAELSAKRQKPTPTPITELLNNPTRI